MKQLTPADVVDIAQYEKDRQAFRDKIMALKQDRRIQVGDEVTLVFENRETVKFQIQEMMRAERIVTDERIQEEIDTYNELIPGANQLSATLLVEIQEKERIRELLDKFIGIDQGETTFVVIGGDRIPAEYEGGHSNEVRISAVHYVRFQLTPEQAERFIAGNDEVKVAIDHPNYQMEAPVPPNVRASLAADLRTG
ncbi:MAG: DUF3501 family protein [Dehalococcoidia bacterium]